MINQSMLVMFLLISNGDNVPENIKDKIQEITKEAYLIQDVDDKLDKLRCMLIELSVEIEKDGNDKKI